MEILRRVNYNTDTANPAVHISCMHVFYKSMVQPYEDVWLSGSDSDILETVEKADFV